MEVSSMTRFSSAEMALDFVADFAHVSRAKAEFKEIELTPEIRKRIRHELQKPVCYKFEADGKQHIIIVDIYNNDEFVCWYVNGNGFGRDL